MAMSSGNNYTRQERDIVISALRYAFHRNTYIVEDTVDYVLEHLEMLGDEQFTLVVCRDLRREFDTMDLMQEKNEPWRRLYDAIAKHMEAHDWRLR